MKETLKNILTGFNDRIKEHQFRIDYHKKLITQIRIGFIISIFIYLVFFFIDNWVFRDLEPLLLLNRITASSLFALIFALSFTAFFQRHLQGFLLLFGIIATTGILWKLRLLNIHGYDFSFFYPGLILTTGIVTFYLRIRFVPATLLNLFSIGAYIFVYLFCLHNDEMYDSVTLSQTFVNSLFFVVGSSFLSVYGAFYLEKFTRKDFETQEEINQLNHNLDLLVKKRTAELETEKKKNVKLLIEGQEKERERISKELHDCINNQISLLKMDLESQMHKNDFDGMQRSINNLLKINEDVRKIAHNHSNFILKKSGIEMAIRSLIDKITDTSTLQFKLHFIGLHTQIPDDISLALYRVLQEALSNIVKHAEASNVEIQIMVYDHTIHLTIADDGKGFDIYNDNNGGIGLNNMKLRIENQCNGELIIDSKIGTGTTITVNVKINNEHD